MKARKTIRRELRNVQGVLARAGLHDVPKARLRDVAQALRWALHDGNGQQRPSEIIMGAGNLRRHQRLGS